MSIGFDKDVIRFRKLYEDKAFYAEESFDLEIKKGDSWVELVACNHRGIHDLSSYEKYGAKGMNIDSNIPKVFELSMGTDRLFYLLLLVSMKKTAKEDGYRLIAKYLRSNMRYFHLYQKMVSIQRPVKYLKIQFIEMIYFTVTAAA